MNWANPPLTTVRAWALCRMLYNPADNRTSDPARNSVLQIDFLGIPLWSFTKADFVDWVITRGKGTLPSTAYAINASSVNIAFKSRAYWDALQRCDAVYCDGISVYWGCRLLGKSVPEKLTTTDCVDPIARRCAEEGLSMYILGNAPGVAQRAAERMMTRHAGLIVRGVHSGHFDTTEERKIVADIKRQRPNVLWVGMGNPVQELWVDKWRHELEVPVILTCGAMMEIVAGKLRRPPRWITDNGFEWAFRLVNQPRHTWKRYLIGNSVFSSRLAIHAWRKRSLAARLRGR